MKCPQCMGAIGPDDRVCPSCFAVLIFERKPTRPEEEAGWFLRHLASIMGRVGCGVMIAQNLLVLIASAALLPQAIAFLSGTLRDADLSGVAPIILVAGAIDLIGLGMIAVALIVLGAGAIFLRRRDPFTEEEVMIPPVTAAFPMAAGLAVFLYVLLTAVWRLVYPSQVGWTAAQILARFAGRGFTGTPPIITSMMSLWIVASISLVVGAAALRMFWHRLPSKIVSARPMKPSSWLDFAVVNMLITFGIALFPLGVIGYDTTGGPAQIAFLTLLATKLTFVPVLGAFAYWSLMSRFGGYGKLSLLVPVLKAVPQNAAPVRSADGAYGSGSQTGRPAAWAPPPSDEDLTGIGRVK